VAGTAHQFSGGGSMNKRCVYTKQCIGIISVLLALLTSRPATAYVKQIIRLTSPADNSTVSGTITIAAAVSTRVVRANFYIDGRYFISGPPYLTHWDTTTVVNGGHSISITAFGTNNAAIGSASVTVNIDNSFSGYYYVSSSAGNDSNNGTDSAHPWRTVGRAASMLSSLQPGDRLLFNGGDVWTAQTFSFGDTPAHAVIGAPGAPIYIGTYGNGKAILDEHNTNRFCFMAIYPLYTVQYLTIDNFECRHAKIQGVTFQTSGGNMPGITVQNMYIHNTGPGCSSSSSACIGNDLGGYYNQLEFLDTGFSEGSGAVDDDGVKFVDNTVKWTGGHNCVQVHYDTGAVLVQGNKVGPGCVHGGIDLKGAGSARNQAVVRDNTCDGGQLDGLAGADRTPCYYTMNQANPHTNILWQGNVAWDTYIALQICPGGVSSGYSAGGAYSVYNNTFYALANSGGTSLVYLGDSACAGWSSGISNQYTLDIRNNIFDGGASNAYTLALVSGGDAYSSCTEDYNNIGGSQGRSGYSTCRGSRSIARHDQNSVNPRYVNPSEANFQLQPGSPEIGAGFAGLTEGNHDIGAY
jgi:Bacterial Ig domain